MPRFGTPAEFLEGTNSLQMSQDSTAEHAEAAEKSWNFSALSACSVVNM
jgi:hypothetical protein